MQGGKLNPFFVDASIVLIDGLGATIKWESEIGFFVSGGARLCIINATLDGQSNHSGLVAKDANTVPMLQDVTVTNCKTTSVFHTLLSHCFTLHSRA